MGDAPTGDDVATVLLVEDEIGLAELYELWLGDEYDVKVANRYATATVLLDETVDVGLFDRNLPDGHGEELLSVIRDRDLECRVAMVTAVQPTADFLELGFDEYVGKPVSKSELRATVERLLAHAEFGATLREVNSLESKIATLESQRPEDDLAGNESYEALQTRYDELQKELAAESEEFTDQQYQREWSRAGASSD